LLNRKVSLETKRSDSHNWSITLIDDALTSKELKLLFEAIEADDWDVDSTYLGEESTRELSQSVSRKLISLLLPFKAETSLADDEGVWFMGESITPKAGVKPALPKKMPMGMKLDDLIAEAVAYEKAAHEDEMHRKGVSELLCNIYKSSIFNEVSGVVEDELLNYFDQDDDEEIYKVIYNFAREGTFLESIFNFSLTLDSVDVSNYGATEQLIRDFCEAYIKQTRGSET